MYDLEELEMIKSLLPMLEKLSNTPGASTQRLMALTTNVDWRKVHTFELDWKVVSVGDTDADELVPLVKMQFIRE